MSLEFDDQSATQLQAAPMLAKRGMHATFFVNSGLIGKPGKLGVAELLALQAQGHEIGGHTIGHADLPGLPPDKQVEQVCTDRNRLLAQGLNAVDFAYPSGQYDAFTEWVVSSCGYLSARTITGVACRGCARSERLPPSDPFGTRTPPPVVGSTTLQQLKRTVLKATRGRRAGWLQFVVHEVCDACGGVGSVSPAILGAFLDWLRVRRIHVATVRQALSRFSTPPIGVAQ